MGVFLITCMLIIIILIVWMHMQIFTNAEKGHAAQVLERLDLEDCFEGVICFEILNNNNNNPSLESKFNGGNDIIICKPSIEAIQAAVKIADTQPNKTVIN